MKRNMLILITTCLAVAAMAGYSDQSNLIITTSEPYAFSVRFNHEIYPSDQRVELTNVNPGRHYIRVDRQLPGRNGYEGRGRVIFRGYVDIAPASRVMARVTARGSLRVTKSPLYADCGQSCAYDACTCSSALPELCNYAASWGAHDCSEHIAPVGTSCSNGYGGYAESGHYGLTSFSHSGFTDFRRSLNSMSFESSKLQAVEAQLNYVRLTSAQARTLMSSFNYDSSRLTLAKMVYPSILDPHQFYLVTEAFTYSSTRNEFYQWAD